MIRERLALAAATFIFASTALAATQTGTEMLFASSSFDDVKSGTTITYSYTRFGDENIPTKAIEDGSISVLRSSGENGRDKSVITLKQNEAQRRLEHLPTDRGNPIFVVFLESSISSIAFATKGSPFYIRNRIKEAFASGGKVTDGVTELDGAEVPATQIEYRPFKGDRNAKKMGAAFENLSIRFTLADAVPGRYAAMVAEASVDGTVYFSEEIRFKSTTEGEDN